ncbi:sensor histidine kinase [Thiogranum longum]
MPADDQTSWQPLRLLTFYRVILAGLLSVLYFALRDSNPFNVQAPALFQSTLLSYLLFGVVIGFATRLRWPAFEIQALVQILADIGAIALLMHATGGVTSSLGVLLVIAVSAGALVLPGRPAYLFAAVAALALLTETGLASLSLEKAEAGSITRAGLLGLVLFAAAGLAHVLAMRLRESEALAQQRGVDLANLQQLNQYIIQQLQAGLLVVDPDNRVRLANDTARRWLKLESKSGMPIENAVPALEQQLRRWKADPQFQAQTIQAGASSNALVPRFSTLRTARGDGALILLEDSAQLARETQQVKLASLGRLTASIAHEIRNPLGAISHAAQLLAESEQLDPSDKRLTEIIGNHTRRVNNIIENVLQLSRRSESHPKDLAINDWLQEFVEELVQSEHIEPGVLELDIPPEPLLVRVDASHLHQILTNLCQNALRHVGDNARIVIRARRQDGELVHMEVIDNGPGIDKDTVEQMFEPFYTTASSGTGLGLYIARELCDINQARLSYHTAPGEGSCFRIQFAAGTH